MSSRTRDFCFTLNNWTEGEAEAILAISCKYVCFGKEVAPGTGTPHLQGYIYFAQPKGQVAVRALIPRAHVEARSRNSSAAQAIAYCRKEGDFYERGTAPVSPEEKGAQEVLVLI